MLRYKLKEGQTFNIQAKTNMRIDFLRNFKIFEDEIEFFITCKIADYEKRRGIYTLNCVISWLEAKSFMNDFLQQVVGDRFVVRKDSRGKIYSVRGGKKIRQFLFGLPMKNVLLWFGSILSGMNGDEEWSYDDGKIFYNFSNSVEGEINGRKLPMIKINGSWNNGSIFDPVTDFKCNGEVLFDRKSGRIAVSRKNLRARLLNVFDLHVDMKAGEEQYIA